MSRDKGKVGEREVVALLKSYGFDARRGQQFKGTKDSPDVISDMPLYIEVKRREQVNLYEAINKAAEEAPREEEPIVFHRKNGKQWLITMNAEDFLASMRDYYDRSN